MNHLSPSLSVLGVSSSAPHLLQGVEPNALITALITATTVTYSSFR